MIGYLMAHAVQKTQPAVALALPDLLLYFHKTFLPFFVTFFLTFFLSSTIRSKQPAPNVC